jgi:tetratricopeptide (TPR) repeat protein
MLKQRRSQPPRRTTKKSATLARPKPATGARTAKPAKPAAAPSRAAATPLPASRTGVRSRVGKPAMPVKARPAVSRPERAAGRPRPAPVPAAAPIAAGPSSHDLAVAAFERGFRALQQRQFARAAELLTSVVNGYPDEKELQERARVYLSICQRQAGGRDSKPRSLEERMNAATVAINRGAFEDGLALLRKLAGDSPDNDLVHYMLGVVYAATGDIVKALAHLRNAVDLNPENRFLATQDADRDPLRLDPGFASLVEAPLSRRRAVARRR